MEVPREARRNEAGALRVDVPVPEPALAVGEESLRHHEMQLIPGARHRDMNTGTLSTTVQRSTQVPRHINNATTHRIAHLPGSARVKVGEWSSHPPLTAHIPQ